MKSLSRVAILDMFSFYELPGGSQPRKQAETCRATLGSSFHVAEVAGASSLLRTRTNGAVAVISSPGAVEGREAHHLGQHLVLSRLKGSLLDTQRLVKM